MAFPVVASSTTSRNASPAKPTGLAIGDLIILMLSAASYVNNNASVSAPDGTWTTIATSSPSSAKAFGIWYKVATATEVAASTFGTFTADELAGMCTRVTGADTVTPVILKNFALVSGASLLTTGISPVFQSLFLNLVCGANVVNSTATATAQAVANSNPSWSIYASTNAGPSSNMVANVTGASANETGAPGSATGNATATLTNNDQAIIAIVSIQPPVFVSDFFSGIFGVFQPTLPVVISGLVSAAWGTFQATAADIAAKWVNDKKNAAATFVNDTKN